MKTAGLALAVVGVMGMARLAAAAETPAAVKPAEAPKAAEHAPAKDTKPVLNLGDAAPPFQLTLYNADAAGMNAFNLRQYVGEDAEGSTKGVLISFFASWCEPCKKELPILVKLNEKYKSKGLQIVSISIDGDEAGFQKINGLVASNKLVHPVAKDRFQLVARKYLGGETTLPAVFLVKRDGTIVFMKQKYEADVSKILEDEIKKVIGG